MAKLNAILIRKKLLYTFQNLEIDFLLTAFCFIHLTNCIELQMDQGHFVGIVLLDLQNAFDTVDHGILLMKLEALVKMYLDGFGHIYQIANN